MKKKIENIADYLDEQIEIYFIKNKCCPDNFELPEAKIKELQELLSKESLELSWAEFRDKNGLLNNYKGIKLKIKK